MIHPKGFKEKVYYFKLHNTDKKHSVLYDKYTVRDDVRKLWKSILFPFKSWKTVNVISRDTLPCKSFLKPTHDSGSV